MRGGFVNMSLENNRADLVRAVVEGVAHNIAWLVPYVEKFTGEASVRSLRGRRRTLGQWCQVLADVLGRPVSPLHAPDTGTARGDGAARVAAARSHRRRGPRPPAAGTPTAFVPDPRATSTTNTVRCNSRPRSRRSYPISEARMSSAYPYAATHDVIRGMPSEGGAASRSSPSSPTSHVTRTPVGDGQVLGNDVLR